MSAMRLLAFILVGLCGCGQLAPAPDSGSDASTDAQLTCTSGKFQTPVAIAELNTPADERGLRFRANETVAVFSRGAESDAGVVGASTVIMEATRAATTSLFSSPSTIFENPNAPFQPGACYPTLSEDGRMLFVETWWYSGFGDGIKSPLMVIDEGPKQADAGTWAAEGVLLAGNGAGPYGTGWDTGDGFANADGSSYYSVFAASDGGLPVIYQNDWSPLTFNEPMGTVYSKAENVILASPDGSTSYDDPIVTLDGLTMYLAIRSGSNGPRVAVTKRTSTSDTFGTPAPLVELDYNDDQYPTWISADGCRLYLTRRVAGQYDLYVANRSE